MILNGRTKEISHNAQRNEVLGVLKDSGAPVLINDLKSYQLKFDFDNFKVYKEIDMETYNYCYIWSAKKT